jgi:hypothetical protein
MKWALFTVFGVGLLCGCRQQPNADLQALSQKLDNLASNEDLLMKDEWVIYTNDAIILKSVDDVKTRVNQNAQNDLYYFTNLLIGLSSQGGRLENNVLVTATNLNQVHEDVLKLKLKLGINP